MIKAKEAFEKAKTTKKKRLDLIEEKILQAAEYGGREVLLPYMITRQEQAELEESGFRVNIFYQNSRELGDDEIFGARYETYISWYVKVD